MSDYSQDLKVKLFPVSTGKFVCVLNEIDAKEFGVFAGDRVEIENKRTKKRCVVIIDVTKDFVKEDSIGLFQEVTKSINANTNDKVNVKPTGRLDSVDLIKKKLNGEKLSSEELKTIVKDIADSRLSDIEASAFMAAVYMKGFDLEETTSMTKALIGNGKKINFAVKPIVDKHSIGGVNGRATMIIVPIVASAGLYIPKTSSRSITSAAGTADAMEILAPIDLSFDKIKSITKKIGGVITWGGAVDLAPADDKIIKIRHPLALDPEGMLIASVLAKKASVGSKYVVIDIPVGENVKIKDKKKALAMAKKFVEVGKENGMEIEAVVTNGDEPSGLAFGPALETKYAMEILEGIRFDNLAQKSCELAGALFELAGVSRRGQGFHKALEILESGQALKKMKEIIKAQGGKVNSSNQIILSGMNKVVKSTEEGVISKANVKALTTIARTAGAPANKLAGLMLHKIEGDKVKKGEVLFTIYAENEIKLASAYNYAMENNPFTFKKIILSTVR
ncbi:MAG: AMP phosphorylase [Candidatus Diapherotrites archaeon]|jgi:AMP phosphorylase|uniref:AMP phosphorylase n=1 Tax=Candidatus Iainarchaeum sp. TaxID=3101447 RepID=A0A8T5GD98_9ARCH|nr:AMP phosphorylase [Candidatus Diapherotrites archaeon]MBT7241223.1 AMP phosphorylase [Candidatus Diapherotrites archaeon]